MEIATMNNYKKNGYFYKNIEYKDNNADLTLTKDNDEFEIQVKHKQSIDDFLDTIQGYIEGMAMLEEYSHLQDKTLYLNINKESLDDSERKKSWGEVVNFIKNKEESLCTKYITIAKRIINIEQIYQSSFANVLSNKQGTRELIEKIIFRVIKKLNNQYENKSENKTFIGVIIWSIPFHEKADFDLIKLKMEELIKVHYQLDITLVPDTLSKNEPLNFTLFPNKLSLEKIK